jgi:hypothetical protein
VRNRHGFWAVRLRWRRRGEVNAGTAAHIDSESNTNAYADPDSNSRTDADSLTDADANTDDLVQYDRV